MKKVILTGAVFVCSLTMMAQGKSQAKSKEKSKGRSEQTVNTDKDKNDKTDHEKKIWEGTYTGQAGGPKPSKNQPAKVRSSFQRDYPVANSVTWSKYRGDWTATFRNGAWISTAVYHANGDRRDTRTLINKESIPKKIFDIITKKPTVKMDDVIRIEVPKAVKDIFRIKNIMEGKHEYLYYDSDGMVVQYNY